ncbi:Disease resistance protein L6 [Linum perenne]
MLPLPTGEYEVFLNFRGPDVRKSFADHLYNCLVRYKIRTFRDEEELQKGETIGPYLNQAIAESKIYIPIFTEGYASSKWCLQELAKMVNCWKTGGGGKGQHIILPVFYFIDPRDVRHPDSGSYKEAFEQYQLKHDSETILEWKEALQEVGKMKGWHVTEQDGQGDVVGKIFTEVESHLRDNYTLVTDELVGIDFQVEEIMKLLNLDSTSEKIIGIHGMGGIGKTTLAKGVYNKVSTRFERCCFLENIRETLSKNDGAVTLQNKLISTILRKDSHQVVNISDGMQVIRDRVCRYKVFIVLDDVDERFQFDDILGKLGYFSSDSRFLITTRDTRALELLHQCKFFELKEMSRDHSLQLFSKHAFGLDYPLKDYACLSGEFVRVAAGLPLALKVIGSLLFKRNQIFWEEKLIEVKEIPLTKVQEILKISYNELTPHEKQIFLDIACLFIGVKKEVPMYMWSDCGVYSSSGIMTLVQRSLVRINDEKEFWMHDQIRDLGRAIVREGNTETPYKCSRIWSNTDAINMLKNREVISIHLFFVHTLTSLVPIDMKGENLVLTSKEFKQFSRLRYLEVWNGRLRGNFKDVLPNIRWLRLYRCDSLPSGLNLKKLAILSLESCSVRDGWGGWNQIKGAHNLKVVNISWCSMLRKCPDLSNCQDLELLDFFGCEKMRGALDIGNLMNLKELIIKKTNIGYLKGDIGRLQNLQKIDVSHSGMVKIPDGVRKLSSLQVLDMTTRGSYNTSKLEAVAETSSGSLKRLAISSSSFHHVFPSSLNYLDICYCMYTQRLPNIGNLTNLIGLRLTDVGIDKVPGLGELKLLETLTIESVPNLENLDGLENLVLLKEMSLQGCSVLEKLPSVAMLTKLHKLVIGTCPVLTEIYGVGELTESLSHLDINGCPSLKGMTLHSVVKLETLALTAPGSTSIIPPSLSVFNQLRRLTISSMSLRRFPDLSNMKHLRDLRIAYCHVLIEVPGLDTLYSLEFLDIRDCRSLRALPDLSDLVNLKNLDLTGCTQLDVIRGLERLEALEILYMSDCESIKELPNLSGLKNLRRLRLLNCGQLKEVNGLEELESLELFQKDKSLKAKYVMKHSKVSWWDRLVHP